MTSAGMTSAAAPLPTTATERTGEWRTRLLEFLVVGGATFVLFPLAWLYRSMAGLSEAELTVSFLAFHAAFVINDPHFGVTYVLFYRDVRGRALGSAFGGVQRARYLVAGFLVPLVMLAWIAGALVNESPVAMGALIQVMFLLVGWHYVKQGFGVFTVLSARRGFRVTPFLRRAVLTHCFAGWAYAWTSPADPGTVFAEKGIVYTSVAHPAGLETVTLAVFSVSTMAVVWALASTWRGERRLPPMAPLTALLVSVWLWTIYSSIDPLMLYVIPALHSVQYLYFVTLLRRNEARAHEGPPSFKGSVPLRLGLLAASALAVGWLLLRGVPDFLDGALALRDASAGASAEDLGPLGATPYAAAFFTFVNIHHYFMDWVIWRRDNPDTRFLRD